MDRVTTQERQHERRQSKSRPVPQAALPENRTAPMTQRQINEAIAVEMTRVRHDSASVCLAYLNVNELPELRERFGVSDEVAIARQIVAVIRAFFRPLDIIGRDDSGAFLTFVLEMSPQIAYERLLALSHLIVAHTFSVHGESVHLTPVVGFAAFGKDVKAEQVRLQAQTALNYATGQLDLEPACYEPSMEPRYAQHRAETRSNWWYRLRRRLSTPLQVIFTFLLALVVPFMVYAAFDNLGRDVTPGVYIVIVVALLITGIMIWLEGFYAMPRHDPPEEPGTPYPLASAIIVADLANEAATIVETVETFMHLNYPGELQIILAYNTRRALPIENILKEMAQRDPRFVPLRVEDSTSKAQNVNAALAATAGEFVGIFDADHQPEPESFSRAWRWLSNGYDVVQGHCLVRNGDSSWIARMVAVEFESMYAVSHPGRGRLHSFGIFGGSNGYWKTELLREIRMHGFMLTEDIDSSMRVTMLGKKIVSDPFIISRELAPTSFKGLWNQRMRWAQGWFQVSNKYLGKVLRSRELSVRQKLGLFYLLGWRELYPWVAVQMFPLIAYWALKYGGLERIDWLVPVFVLTSLFTLTVGPGQTILSYRLASPEIRKHKRWFWSYLLVTSLPFVEFKNVITRVAQVKEVMHERRWNVTSRAPTKGSALEHSLFSIDRQ